MHIQDKEKNVNEFFFFVVSFQLSRTIFVFCILRRKALIKKFFVNSIFFFLLI
jgi:hypothetical protein